MNASEVYGSIFQEFSKIITIEIVEEFVMEFWTGRVPSRILSEISRKILVVVIGLERPSCKTHHPRLTGTYSGYLGHVHLAIVLLTSPGN